LDFKSENFDFYKNFLTRLASTHDVGFLSTFFL
jgi:hypothetical protein